MNPQTVAKKLHGTEVDMQILKTKDECDHVQFLITDSSAPGATTKPITAELETLSVGKVFEWNYYIFLNLKFNYYF